MRCDSQLDERQIVALWMAGVNALNDLNIDNDFSVMVRRMKIGKGGVKRPFLKPGCQEAILKGKTNTTRKSCVVLFLDDQRWPQNLLQKVKKGKRMFGFGML